MDFAMATVGAVRKMRNDYGITKQKPHLFVAVTDAGGCMCISRLFISGGGACWGCATTTASPSRSRTFVHR